MVSMNRVPRVPQPTVRADRNPQPSSTAFPSQGTTAPSALRFVAPSFKESDMARGESPEARMSPTSARLPAILRACAHCALAAGLVWGVPTLQGQLTLVSPNSSQSGQFGKAVAGVADLDGDGVGEVLIGAPLEEAGSANLDLG